MRAINFDDRLDGGGGDGTGPDATPEVIAFAQPAEGVVNVQQTNVVAFAAPVTKDDLLIVECNFDGNTLDATISDSLGNTFTRLGPFDNSFPSREFLAYAIANATGADTVTSTLTGTATGFFELRTYELTGVSVAAPIGQPSVMSGTTSGPDALVGPPLVTDTANELIFAIAVLSGTDGMAGTGYTTVSTFDNDLVEDRLAPTVGSYPVTASSDPGAVVWELVAVGVRPGP